MGLRFCCEFFLPRRVCWRRATQKKEHNSCFNFCRLVCVFSWAICSFLNGPSWFHWKIARVVQIPLGCSSFFWTRFFRSVCSGTSRISVDSRLKVFGGIRHFGGFVSSSIFVQCVFFAARTCLVLPEVQGRRVSNAVVLFCICISHGCSFQLSVRVLVQCRVASSQAGCSAGDNKIRGNG